MAEDARDTARPAADDAGIAEPACILVVDDRSGRAPVPADSSNPSATPSAGGRWESGLAMLDPRSRCVIVDYAMPGMTGAESEARKVAHAHLPILFAPAAMRKTLRSAH